jgi:hypothetical protein
MASVLGRPREGVSRHLFVGGNFLVLQMLRHHRTELEVEALASELEATERATRDQLADETAAVTVTAARDGRSLVVAVEVRNLAGHKFPTGYPSRRTWLHVTVADAAGQVWFESGAIRRDGSIEGNDNDDDGTLVERHYDRITQPDQVQIYESVMGIPAGVATTGLLSATQYLKDNRLLPRGFDKATAPADIAVRGDAHSDPTFEGGGDRVEYRISAAGAAGALSVQAELRYQPIGFRWAQNLRSYDAAEPRRFVAWYDELASASSIVVAHSAASVP